MLFQCTNPNDWLNIKQLIHIVVKYTLFVFLLTCIAVGYNWCLHCEELVFLLYSHTHKEYSTLMWRLRYMLGTRYAQYTLWAVTTVSGSIKENQVPDTKTLALNGWCLILQTVTAWEFMLTCVTFSLYAIWPTCVSSNKMWTGCRTGHGSILYISTTILYECYYAH